MKNGIKIIGIIIAVVTLTSYIVHKNSPSKNLAHDDWTGNITAIDEGCFVDGVCRIKVGRHWIITNLGELSYQESHQGTLSNYHKDTSYFTEEDLGQEVEVYVGLNKHDKLTLYGDDNYHIRSVGFLKRGITD